MINGLTHSVSTCVPRIGGRRCDACRARSANLVGLAGRATIRTKRSDRARHDRRRTHGHARLRQFLKHPDVRIGAICDVDQTTPTAPWRGRKSPRPEAENLWRLSPLLEDREIDAVAVVTPDHWHAIPTVRAFEAGKDVFVEKPLSYSVAEGRAMADASLKYKRVSQMGNHIHNDLPNYRRVVEIVQSGKLGRITRVHFWKTCQRSRPPRPIRRRCRPRSTTTSGWVQPRNIRTNLCDRTSPSAISGTTRAARSSISGATSSTWPCGRSI